MSLQTLKALLYCTREKRLFSLVAVTLLFRHQFTMEDDRNVEICYL